MTVVHVGGFAATGGSAIRDYLFGSDQFAFFGAEFRLLRDRYGLMSMYHALRKAADSETTDLILRDFEWLAFWSAREGGLRNFRGRGRDYDRLTRGRFTPATVTFLNSITSYRYPMNWDFFSFRKTFTRHFRDSVFGKIGLDVKYDARMVFFEDDVFMNEASRYLKEIFSGVRDWSLKSQESPLLLHNTVSNQSYEEIDFTRMLVPNSKFLIVDRDPRDIFLDLPEGRYLPSGVSPLERSKAFVRFFMHCRRDLEKLLREQDVLLIRFEDFVLDHETEARRLWNFLGLPIPKKSSGNSFNVSQSARNTELYKNAVGQEKDAIRHIENELKGFLHRL